MFPLSSWTGCGLRRRMAAGMFDDIAECEQRAFEREGEDCGGGDADEKNSEHG